MRQRRIHRWLAGVASLACLLVLTPATGKADNPIFPLGSVSDNTDPRAFALNGRACTLA